MTLPVALAGHDVIGQAKTGTGKTLGFGIPMLQRIIAPTDPEAAEVDQPAKPQALVIVPTRELAIQVAGDLRVAGRLRGVRVAEIYGGRAYEPQIEMLRTGVELVVGTPGRLIDLAGQRHLDLSHVKVLVLDEADEMLDLGFLPDVEKLVARTPANRQTMLFSATMPGQIVAMARRYMTQPTHIRASSANDEAATVDTVEQHVYRVHEMDKPELLSRVLQAEGRGLTIVFCRTKRACDRVALQMTERGFAAAPVHGDLGQGARERALRAFRAGKVDVLVATDVAARGIDVDGVTHVINYTCPEDEKTYLHRVGRTARAGNAGVAVTFVDWADVPRWGLINKALGLPFVDPPETYSTSAHVYTALKIPAGATGVLPRAARVRAGLDAETLEDVGETGRPKGATKPDTRGGRSGERRTEPAPEPQRSATPRTRSRSRTRSRAGEPAAPAGGGGEATTATPAGTASSHAERTAGAPGTGPTGSEPGDGSGTPRRRRRRRGGAGRSSGSDTAAPTTPAVGSAPLAAGE